MKDEDKDRSTPVTPPLPAADLPHVDPAAAPSMEDFVPGPPRVPTIEERRERTTSPPGAFTGQSGADMDPLSGFRTMLEQHEEREQDIADKLRRHVDESESQAAQERAQLKGQLVELKEQVATVVEVFNPPDNRPGFREQLRGDFREEAAHVADKFLEPIGTLIKTVADLQESVQLHTLIFKRLDKLKLEELREQHDKLVELVETVQGELATVKRMIAARGLRDAESA